MVRALQAQGVAVWGVETTDGARSAFVLPPPAARRPAEESAASAGARGGAPAATARTPVALVFGNEIVGVSPGVLRECDDVVKIPTLGRKNSLNVACAASIVIYECLRQWEYLGDGGGDDEAQPSARG